MSKIFSGVMVVIAFVIAISFQNCGGQPSSSAQNNGTAANNNITVTGTVVKSQVECTSLQICHTDSITGVQKCFLPLNIDPTLLNEGNVVEVNGVIRTDLVNVCLGSTLQVNSAQLVSGSTVPPAAAN